MGDTLHHAIVVTSWSGPDIDRAAGKARELGCTVIGPSKPQTNGYRTFCVVPDGSKEGWDTSNEGDTRRDQFVEWMNAQRNEEGGYVCDWFEASFGYPDENAEVTRCERSMAPDVRSEIDNLMDAVLDAPLSNTPTNVTFEGFTLTKHAPMDGTTVRIDDAIGDSSQGL